MYLFMKELVAINIDIIHTTSIYFFLISSETKEADFFNKGESEFIKIFILFL